MKLAIACVLAFLVSNLAWSADNIFGDPRSGNFQLKDNSGTFWNAYLADTTNGNGDIYTLGGVVAGDSIIGTGTSHELIDNAGRHWPLSIWYTTDGSGNVIPISGGGGGGGVWGSITGTLSDQTDLQSALNAKQSTLSFSSPLVNTAGTVSLGAVPVTLNGVPAAVRDFYVDGNRTDSYTADGSFSRPYKTIQSAINAVAAINSSDTSRINVAPKHYSENLALNSTGLKSVTITCSGGAGTCWFGLNNGSPALDSSSSNGGLVELIVDGFEINGPIQVIGAQNNGATCVTGCTFSGITSINGSAWTLKNLFAVVVRDTYSEANLTIENVSDMEGYSWQNYGSSTSIVTNLANNHPGGLTETDLFLFTSSLNGSISVDAASYFQSRNGSRIGSVGTAMTLNGIGEFYNSTIRSNVTINSGGELDDHGNSFMGTVTNSGTLSIDGKYLYSPTTSAHWSTVPTTVKGALDSVRLLSQSAVGSKPACSSGNRGLQWLIQGGAGVADIYQVCQKDAADAYGWVTH